MTITTLGLVLSAVVLNTAAQFVLKAGAQSLSQHANPGLVTTLVAASVSPHILGGLALYVASFGLWIVVLSRLEVSVAYPMLSLGYVLAALVAHLWLGEALTLTKLSGIGLVIAGVYLLSKAPV